MRRPARGATTHPTLARPGMGYGRPLRVRPGSIVVTDFDVALRAFLRGDVDEIEVLPDLPSVTRSDTRS
jgi:hypothetical protein